MREHAEQVRSQREKVQEQKLLGNSDINLNITQSFVVEIFLKFKHCFTSYLWQSLKILSLEQRAKVIEENYALKSNIDHLDKMERRYRNIFEVIEQKHAAIQNNYRNLMPENKNLADYERFKG